MVSFLVQQRWWKLWKVVVVSHHIRLRASIRNGLTTVQAVLQHPMHTGNHRDPESDKIIPALFIEMVTVHHESMVIMTCDWSRAVSKNPYLSFAFSGAKIGDSVRISWQDSAGNTASNTTAIR